MPEFFRIKRRLLVLAHREELLDQAAAKFSAAAPELSVGIEQGPRTAAPDSRIVLASVSTLGRQGSERLNRLAPEDFYLIVVDEAHHAVASTYRRVLDHFGVFDPDSRRLLVGFTATPRRGDKKALSSVFQAVAYTRSLPDMVRAGYLCPLRGWRVSTSINIGSVSVRHGDFAEGELASLVDVPERNELVVKAYQELAAGRRTIAFCVNVAHVQALALAFLHKGIAAAPVWGAMAKDERATLLRRFHEGSLQVLTNCNVLTEGFDEPAVDCVLMARPTQSQVLYAQMVGRGTRLHQDKSDLIVIDIVDNTSRHKLISLNSLFDLPDTLDPAGRPALQVVDELERLSSEAPWIDLSGLVSAEELDLVTQRVDLFRLEPPDEIAPFTEFAWCGRPDGDYRLNLTDGEWVLLREDNLGCWQATLHQKGSRIGIASSPKLSRAIEAVDRFVVQERPKVVPVLRVTAGWRDLPPTEKQREMLRRFQVPVPPQLTRGQASWLITHSTAQRRRF